jgi:hypothetical protein
VSNELQRIEPVAGKVTEDIAPLWCPVCGRAVARTHFSCASGAMGGAATGASKARPKTASKAGKAGAAARWGKKNETK